MAENHRSRFTPAILECANIREILKFCTFNTSIIFDLDNTILRPTHEEDLGSDQWFRKVLERALEKIPHRPRALRSAIALNNQIQRHIKIKSVEPNTPQIIHILQDLNLTTVAVTARRYDIADVTFNQLSAIDVNMTHHEHDMVSFTVDGRHIYFKNNVLFCDGADKGVCLAELMRIQHKPCANIVMLDDVRENLQKVHDVMAELGIEFHGLRYNHLDQRVANFDLKRANTKLSQYSLFFSRSVANIVRDMDLDVGTAPVVQASEADLQSSGRVRCVR